MTNLTFLGEWDAYNNIPHIANLVGNVGDMYYIVAEGTQDLGSGATPFFYGHRAILNGLLIWENISPNGGGTVINITPGLGLTSTPNPIVSSGIISMTPVGTAGTYGSSTNIPQITTDSTGRITTVSLIPLSTGITPSALSKNDDTNVTITLSGTPSTALLQATTITLGWTGTLADSRITSATTWNNKVTSLTGTTNRITIGGTTTIPTVDVSTSYIGQATITTLGTISTGTWNGTAIDLASYVSGNLAVSHLNSGTSASSSTFWRGDGSWSVPAGTGVTSVSGTTNQINSTGGTTPVLSIATNAIFPGAPTIVTPGNSTQNIITTDATQTLSSKTLTSPTIAKIANLTTNGIVYTASGDGTLSSGPLSGDITTSALVATLANTAVSAASYGSATASPTYTVDSKGRLTAASNVIITPAVGSITGLGTGIATWLATPSSANLASAITDETGSGALVFGTAPTFTTSITMADSSNIILNTGTGTKIGTGTTQKLGFFNATPVVQQSGAIDTALSNLGLVTSPTITPTSYTGLIEEIDFEDNNSSIAATTYTLTCYAHYGFTINLLKVICTSGTCNTAVKINGTSVTGISAIATSSTIATGTATAANTVVAGDIVTLVTSSNSSLVDIRASIKLTRT